MLSNPHPQTIIHRLKYASGRAALRFPAGPLLCPHYAVWDSDASEFVVYIPRGDGVVRRGETAKRITYGAACQQHAELVKYEASKFAEVGNIEDHQP